MMVGDLVLDEPAICVDWALLHFGTDVRYRPIVDLDDPR